MRNKITFLICIIFIAVVLKLLTLSPKFIENFYSRKAYKVIYGSIGKVTSNFSFSFSNIIFFIDKTKNKRINIIKINKSISPREKLKFDVTFPILPDMAL